MPHSSHRAASHRFLHALRRLGRKLPSRVIALSGLAIAIAAWCLDAAIDIVFFTPDTPYLDSLLYPDAHEAWMRCFISFLLLALSFIAAALIKQHESAEAELTYNKSLLERFTRDLEEQNTALQHEIERRKAVEQRLAELATTDPLTGVCNRRKFDETLQEELKRETRYKRGLALIILDIDYFKEINDQHGHAIGDRVLKALADLIRDEAREADSFFRIGGEEFALLTYTASTEELADAAERLRILVQAYDFDVGHPLTISLGASRFLPGDNTGSLFKRTDEALYQAKGAGRNRVALL